MTVTDTISLRQFFRQHAAQAEAPYLCVASGHLSAKPEDDEHALWTVEHLPKDEVALKCQGLYITVNKNGQIHMSKDRNHDAHFHFVKEEVDHPGCVAIKDSHGGFLALEPNSTHVVSKKHLSELDDPARLPYFKLEDHKTASKQHHGHGHHNHGHHSKDHL